ncbi:hypothetical protein [Priestia megaterium]|uniref:hypothetical protein n=1 Tax=Priestia megaterium TaxID=1404 RepID=UPI002E23F9EB|nr:hypothetical protein [Priestia megaterium]
MIWFVSGIAVLAISISFFNAWLSKEPFWMAFGVSGLLKLFAVLILLLCVEPIADFILKFYTAIFPNF